MESSAHRDLGTSLELKNGLNGGEKVLISPPVDLRDGSKVKVAAENDQTKEVANNSPRK